VVLADSSDRDFSTRARRAQPDARISIVDGSPIAVAYDGTEPAQRALDRAVDEAKAANESVLVIVVLATEFSPLAPAVGPVGDDEGAELLRAGVTPPDLVPIIDEARERLRAAGVSGDVIWSVGDAAQEIVDEAQVNHASKLVIGAHHHRRFEHLLGTDVSKNIEKDERKRGHIPVEVAD
jgi:nucleotide-binding universal stress UspA family protein